MVYQFLKHSIVRSDSTEYKTKLLTYEIIELLENLKEQPFLLYLPVRLLILSYVVTEECCIFLVIHCL